jgi:threonine dehydrogenase-like Zn-dependent dehydrogenase
MGDTVRDPTMPAAVYRSPSTIAVENRPVPTLEPGEVLIEVSHCGICGSDLHFVLEGWSAPNRIHGHEYSGVIAAVGDDVRDWQVGDEVVGGAPPRCGHCAMCLAHRPSLCVERDTPGKGDDQGAFARYIAVDQRQLHRLPGELDSRAAALAEPLAVALHAITTSRIADDQTAMVFGAGPIGALILAVLRARRHEVAVVEPGPARAELAGALGAQRVLTPDEIEVPTIAEPERIVEGAVDIVFECSGRRAAMEAGLAQLRRGGTLVLVGAGIDPPHFDGNRILLNELLITGSYCYDDHGFEHALELLASGRLPIDQLIDTEDVALDAIVPAMRRLVAGDIAGKVLVDPRLPTEGSP